MSMVETEHVVVAIDGPAGAGKSTIARRVAEKMGYVYIDTGAMYRAVALAATRSGIDLADAGGLAALAQAAGIRFEPGSSRVFLNGEDVTQPIRDPEISSAASKVSAVPAVRRALVEKQRRMGASSDVVMEGRDIGTVVFPNATVKLFLDANPEIRAGRRVLELEQKGVAASAGDVAREMQERDRRDSTRADSPLVRAEDAVYLDTSTMTIDAVENAILKIIADRIHVRR